MPLIVTPRQHLQRSELYHQIGQLTSAGIGLPQALETLRRSPPARSFRVPLARLADSLQQGGTFGEAIESLGTWMPSFDAALLQAGEKSGRLPASLALLANYYQERAHLTRQVMADLAYPVFLFHFAILIGPVPGLFLSGNVTAYLCKTLGVFLPIYALVIAFLYAGQGQHGENWRGWVERILRFIPLCGSARRNLALARLSAALEALINAGVSLIDGWELAATASGSPALRRAILRSMPAPRQKRPSWSKRSY